MRWTMALCGVLLAGSARAEEARWSDEFPAVAERVAAGEPLVVRVVVPLCHNALISCGDGGLGAPGDLRHNLYWGALYGARRFFDRPGLGWESLGDQPAPDGVLERRVYRRRVPGKVWGRDESVEELVVLDAIHGARIDDAVGAFWRNATEGGRALIRDGGVERVVDVGIAGYAGHNRLMDGLRLPRGVHASGPRTPSFVLACFSESYFAATLTEAGSAPLVTTTAYVAPEGYALEATVRALGDNPTKSEIRQRVIAAYAKWQNIPIATAARIFTR